MRVLAVADDLCTRKAGCVAGTGGSTEIAGGGGSFGRAMTDEEQLPSDVRPDSYADNGEEWQWIESSNCTREKRLRNIPGIHITSMPFWIRLWQHQTRSRVGSRRPPRFLLRVAQETKKEPCKSVCARSL